MGNHGFGLGRGVCRFPLVAALFVLLLANAGLAAAHSVTLLRSEPVAGAVLDQSPRQIAAKFSEELNPKGSILQIFTEEDKPVGDDTGKLDLKDLDHATLVLPISKPVPDGNYRVRWQATLLDGDSTTGVFVFTVGKNTAPPKPIPAATVASAAAADPSTTTAFLVILGGTAAVIALGVVAMTVAKRKK